MDNSDILLILIISTIVIAVISFRGAPKNSSQSNESENVIFPPERDFHIYNHYLIPVFVVSQTSDQKSFKVLVENVLSKGRKSISINDAKMWLTGGHKIKIYADAKLSNLIGVATVNTPPEKLIKELHVGMSSSHYDISIAAEPPKSPLGTALSLVRIINTSPRTLKINENIVIPPFRAYLYYGQYQNGIPLGTVLRDRDGILDNFVIGHPVTDIHMGLISDIAVPLYTGAKIGGEFDDRFETSTINFPLELLPDYQRHKGMDIDRAYIPKNW